MAKEFLIWTCCVVFALTSLIALLGVLRIIKLEQSIQKKLFNVIIIEVATSVVVFFSAYLKENETDFVKITNPMISTTDFHLGQNQNFNNILFCGASLIASKHYLRTDVYNNGKLIKSEYLKDQNHLFSFNLANSEYKSGDRIKFKAIITNKQKIILADSVIVNVMP